MAEQGLTTYYSLLRLAGIKGVPAKTLFERNPIIRDAPVLPANEKMGHSGSRPSSLPSPAFRKVSGYTTPATAAWSPFTEDISIVDGGSAIPEDVVRIEGAEKLVYIEMAHREAFIQAIANHWLQGTTATAPEKYRSFHERYLTPDDESGSNSPENPASTADVNVYDAGGNGSDTTSIWFFRWGPQQAHVITPTNDPQMGIRDKDQGLVEQWSTNTWRNVYLKKWEWWHGLCVPNQKCVARIRNIESSLASIDTSLITLIYRCLNEGMSEGMGTIYMYIPPRLKTHFDVMANAKQNVIYSKENPYQQMMMMFAGTVPVQVCDAIPITETAVSAA